MAIKYKLAVDASLKLLLEPFDPLETGKVIDAFADSWLLARLHARMVEGLPPEQVEKLRTLTLTPLQDERLLAMPENSFGHRYVTYMHGRGYALNIKHDIYPPVDEVFARNWFLQRMARVHDMLHLLLGFGVDPPGEAAMFLFHIRNFREPFGAMAMAILPFILRRHGQVRKTALELQRSWRLASAAENIFVTPIEEMLEEELGEVRHRLGIPPPLTRDVFASRR
jgi:ubiquinone biosynthesis protein Coq4